MKRSTPILCLLCVLLTLTGAWAMISPSIQAQEAGDPYADRVVSFTPGEGANPEFGDPDTVLGPPDFNEATLSGFLNLGVGGSVTVAFEDNVAVDGPGPDIRIYGDPGNDERWVIEVSQDGVTFVSFDDLPEVTVLDLADVGLPETRFVRLTDDGSPTAGLSPGAELDAVEAVNSFAPPQPQQVYLRAVEPPEGQPGQELELALLGGGFEDAAEVRVSIGGIKVLDAWVESNEEIIAHVSIPEDAPPGPRPVEVVAVFGPGEEFPAGLDAGFFVLERPTLPPFVDGVEPQQVRRGSELELNVFGGNFLPDAWVEIEGVLVHEVEFINAEHLRAFVEVRDDAPAGWREVTVINPDGQTGGRERALEVIGEGPTPLGPTPTSSPALPSAPTATSSGPDGGGKNGLIPDWVWASATVLLSGLSFAVGRALTLKSKLTWTDKARVQWRVEAEKKLPDPQRACQWACKGNVSADLLDRWRVTTIELTPLPLPKGKTQPPKRVEGNVLTPLNDLANIGKILHREDEVRRRLAPIVDALLAQIMTWEQEGQTPASIRVEAKLEAPINGQFGLYHCEQTKGGLGWGKPLVTWKGKLNQPGGEFLGVLRGPTVGEPDFAARARQELEACLLDLISVARFRL